MSPTVRRWSGRSTRSSTRRSSSRMATRVSRWLPLIRISRFKMLDLGRDAGPSGHTNAPTATTLTWAGRTEHATGSRVAEWPQVYTTQALCGRERGAAASVADLAQDLPRDHDPLDLAGPLADLADLGVAHHPLHRIFGGIPVAAEDLDRLGGAPHRQFGAEELGPRRLLLEGAAVLLEPGGMVQEVGAGLDLGVHVGELEAHPLEAADRPAELLALAGVPDGLVVGPLGDSQAQGGDPDPP